MFFLMVAVWCYAAYRLARLPAVALAVARYGHWIVPTVFVGLGLFILWESGAWGLLVGLTR